MVKHTHPDQQRLLAIVVPNCDSVDTCLYPAGRPLKEDEMPGVLCNMLSKL